MESGRRCSKARRPREWDCMAGSPALDNCHWSRTMNKTHRFIFATKIGELRETRTEWFPWRWMDQTGHLCNIMLVLITILAADGCAPSLSKGPTYLPFLSEAASGSGQEMYTTSTAPAMVLLLNVFGTGCLLVPHPSCQTFPAPMKHKEHSWKAWLANIMVIKCVRRISQYPLLFRFSPVHQWF